MTWRLDPARDSASRMIQRRSEARIAVREIIRAELQDFGGRGRRSGSPRRGGSDVFIDASPTPHNLRPPRSFDRRASSN